MGDGIPLIGIWVYAALHAAWLVSDSDLGRLGRARDEASWLGGVYARGFVLKIDSQEWRLGSVKVVGSLDDGGRDTFNGPGGFEIVWWFAFGLGSF